MVVKGKEEMKQAVQSETAGQSEHLFGSDGQNWLKSGLSQLTATWEVLPQSVISSAVFQPIHLVDRMFPFTPEATLKNTLKARGSPSPC